MDRVLFFMMFISITVFASLVYITIVEEDYDSKYKELCQAANGTAVFDEYHRYCFKSDSSINIQVP